MYSFHSFKIADHSSIQNARAIRELRASTVSCLGLVCENSYSSLESDSEIFLDCFWT